MKAQLSEWTVKLSCMLEFDPTPSHLKDGYGFLGVGFNSQTLIDK